MLIDHVQMIEKYLFQRSNYAHSPMSLSYRFSLEKKINIVQI